MPQYPILNKFIEHHAKGAELLEPKPDIRILAGCEALYMLNAVFGGWCGDFLTPGDRADLVFMDPPFNFGVDYGSGIDDRKEEDVFRTWMNCVCEHAKSCLTPNGSMWLNVPDEMAADIDHHCVRELGMRRINWCIWHYRFGFYNRDRFTRCKSHALWYGRSDSVIFNGDDVLVESVREQMGDERAEFGGRVPMDVWGFEKYWGRVQGNSKERRPNHPNQLPEVYLERIIRACSNRGSLVVDPFVGSGTTAVVASALGRRFLGGDLSPDNARSAAQRVSEGCVRIKPEV